MTRSFFRSTFVFGFAKNVVRFSMPIYNVLSLSNTLSWDVFVRSVLPPGLASLLQTPSSYLIGVLTGPTPNFINLRNVPAIGEVVLFDLDNSGSEPYFLNIPDPQRAVPDLTRRNFEESDRISLPDMLYQDLSEVLKLDKKMMFWQGAVQEKLGMVANRGKTLAKATMKKGLKYLKSKSRSNIDGKDASGVAKTEAAEEEEAEEEFVEGEGASTKFVGKGNYGYEHGFPNEAAEVEVRVAFSTFFVSVMGDLRSYLTQQTPGAPPVVDKEKFMKYRNANGDVPGTAMFILIGNLVQSKVFDLFVEARIREVQMRCVVPEDAPLFALVTNFHRSNKIDFYVNNIRQSVRQIASNPNLPGKYLISWNESVRRRALELTSTQTFNGDPKKALALLTEDCHESSTILIDTMMVLWTRIQEGKGLQWKKTLLALQVFRDLLLNGPINAVAEAIDGFASIRILKLYNEALRWQNSILIRSIATEIYSLVVDLPVLFARRRECLNRRRLAKDPKPSPLRKETRMIKGISQFRNVHIALRPAGASVAPAPTTIDDLLGQEVSVANGVGNSTSATASVLQSGNYSNDLLSLIADVSPPPPVTTIGNSRGDQNTPDPFNMDALSQAASQVMPQQWAQQDPPIPPSQLSSQQTPHQQQKLNPVVNLSPAMASSSQPMATGQFSKPNISPAPDAFMQLRNSPVPMQPRQMPTSMPQGGTFSANQPQHGHMAPYQPQRQPWGNTTNQQVTPYPYSQQLPTQSIPFGVGPPQGNPTGPSPPAGYPTTLAAPPFQQGMQQPTVMGMHPYSHPPGVQNPTHPFNAHVGGVILQPGQQQVRKPAFSQFDPMAP